MSDTIDTRTESATGTSRPRLLDKRNDAPVTRGYALRSAVQSLTAPSLGAGPSQAAAMRAQAWASIATMVDNDGYILDPT